MSRMYESSHNFPSRSSACSNEMVTYFKIPNLLNDWYVRSTSSELYFSPILMKQLSSMIDARR